MLWALKTFDLRLTPLLPLLFGDYLGMCNELLSVFLFSHLLTLVFSGFCIPLKVIHSHLPWAVLILGWTPSLFMYAPTGFVIDIYVFYVFCAVYLVMHFMTLRSLLSFVASITFLGPLCLNSSSPGYNLYAYDLICLFSCGWLLYYFCHHIAIIYNV